MTNDDLKSNIADFEAMILKVKETESDQAYIAVEKAYRPTIDKLKALIKPPEYEISTLQDITEVVTTANLDSFLFDLKSLLLHVILSNAAAGEKLKYPNFTWTDDGKNNLDFKIRGGDLELKFKVTDNKD